MNNNMDINSYKPLMSAPPDQKEPANLFEDYDKITIQGLKDILVEDNYAKKIKTIADLYIFSIEKGEILASVVRDIVMGYVFLGDMTTEIEKRLGVDERTAGEIGDMLLADVFAENWDELQVWNVGQYRKREAEKKNSLAKASDDKTDDIFRGQPPSVTQGTVSRATANNAIATTTSYRYTPRDAIINSGYNPKAPRLTPFLTSADRQQRIIGTTAVVKPQEINKPSPAVGKIIDLRKK